MDEEHLNKNYGVIYISKCLEKLLQNYTPYRNRNMMEASNITDFRQCISNLKSKTCGITIIGLQEDLSLDILEAISESNVQISIISSKNERDISEYLQKISLNNRFNLDSVCIKDFVGENFKKNIDFNAIRHSDACFFYGHGDYLCMNMKDGILCGKSKKECIGEGRRLPKCVIGEECFRKQRLGNNQCEVISISELQAKFIFLNTCGGIAFKDRKYEDYDSSLYNEAIKNNCYVYISNYMIGYYSVEELKMYYALLVRYKNFALALYYYNLFVKQYLRKKVSTIMIGDVGLKAYFINQAKQIIEESYKIVHINDELIEIEFNTTLFLNTAVFEINKDYLKEFDLLETIPVDKNGFCNYSVGMCYDKTYKVLIYSEFEEFHTTILFYRKCKVEEKINFLLGELQKCKFVADFRLGENYINKNLKLFEYFENELIKSNAIQDRYKINIEKCMIVFHILRKCEKYLEKFNDSFFRQYVYDSTRTDSALVLNSMDSLQYINNENTRNCSICGASSSVVVRLNTAFARNTYYQRLCSKCEIYSVSQDSEESLTSNIEFIENKRLEIKYKLNKDMVNINLGIVILNTRECIAYQLKNTKELNNKVFSLEVDPSNKCGLYYVRSIVVSDFRIYILNRQFFF